MSRRTCAVITLDHTGGGVAAVSRLVWRTFRERWAAEAKLVALRDQPDGRFGAYGDLPARVMFGTRLATAQAIGESRWTFYTHLALAQVQHFVPAALQRPYAIFLHGIEVWRPLTPALERALAGARLVVTNSEYTANRVADMHPWVRQMSACPLALEDAEPRPAPAPAA